MISHPQSAPMGEQELIELGRLLETATDASRELDHQIAKAVGADYGPRSFVSVASRSYHEYDEIAKRYTSSIDAALTLVPEGLGLTINRYWIARVEHAVWCAVIGVGGVPDKVRTSHEAYDTPNAALALCIAALKARHALSSNVRGGET